MAPARMHRLQPRLAPALSGLARPSAQTPREAKTPSALANSHAVTSPAGWAPACQLCLASQRPLFLPWSGLASAPIARKRGIMLTFAHGEGARALHDDYLLRLVLLVSVTRPGQPLPQLPYSPWRFLAGPGSQFPWISSQRYLRQGILGFSG
ncbi:hypothetical protein WJX84_010694 [Apatococcus fuscideae]|uniref:Uncharacterized protein n=1 Tax=Apatococcus fuscideae TaxID=2026836 RepID=A0AAW1TCV0_9CHLO